MNRSERTGTAVDVDVLERLRSVLARHPISFAMLFGSAARDTREAESDLDLAVEFDAIRPTDEGYSQTYLQFQSAVEEAIPLRVDVVDVHSMSPAFARAACEQGEVIVGSDEQRADLASDLAGAAPSVADAHEWVAGPWIGCERASNCGCRKRFSPARRRWLPLMRCHLTGRIVARPDAFPDGYSHRGGSLRSGRRTTERNDATRVTTCRTSVPAQCHATPSARRRE